MVKAEYINIVLSLNIHKHQLYLLEQCYSHFKFDQQL